MPALSTTQKALTPLQNVPFYPACSAPPTIFFVCFNDNYVFPDFSCQDYDIQDFNLRIMVSGILGLMDFDTLGFLAFHCLAFAIVWLELWLSPELGEYVLVSLYYFGVLSCQQYVTHSVLIFSNSLTFTNWVYNTP